MKLKILSIFITTLTLIGCERYQEPSLLSLSGTYVINRIAFETNDALISNLEPPDRFVNSMVNDDMWCPFGSLDTIILGETTLSFDYLQMYRNPIDIDTRIVYLDTIYYTSSSVFLENIYEVHYIHLIDGDCDRIVSFEVSYDGVETLILRSNAIKTDNTYETTVFFLKRTGP